MTAAGIAVIEAIDEDKLLENARVMGDYIQDKLRKMAKRLKVIREVRGTGLMIGIELEREGAGVVKTCMQNGLLINCTHGNVLRFMPSMTVTKREVNQALKIMQAALKECN